MNKQFYVNGEWIDPAVRADLPVINPATEKEIASISLGGPADVDVAVAAARTAFVSFSHTTREMRLSLLEDLLHAYERHFDEMAETICDEMGAPITLARQAQAACGRENIAGTIEALKVYPFLEHWGSTAVSKVPVGVCGLITPWNWPINQITCKVAPALAAGCTMVLKPSEVAPLSGLLFAQICSEAGIPAGVFNLVNGDGPSVGQALSTHRDVDMVSITGSTHAGMEVSKCAANTVKRVCLELGGKSANIILEDSNLNDAVANGALRCFSNSGQTCTAPTRMLVPATLYDQAIEIARKVSETVVVGNPRCQETAMGPLVNKAQYTKVRKLIRAGIDEGAVLAAGGTEMPEGIDKGYYIKPTVLSNVTNDMRIAREEVFGPVLCVLRYETEDEAIEIANDSDYGLSGCVWSENLDHARRVANEMRTGAVHINGAPVDFRAPFGGFKQSGNGRERGRYGIDEYLETKSIMGYGE